ncbi:MAG: glutamate--tRNA ligase [Defluviitaleaceae bacterium]|nr:glutamate--tRNA ligase [Defluviitaleaceae bacterium]
MIRTRFAPSPTGSMHIGNLRTALYEYLIAKRHGGVFVLRIEDTDQSRLVDGAMGIIFDTLKLTGLNYDEGPLVGGDYGPYIQSERKSLYMPYAKELVEKQHAYYCFCTKEQLESRNLQKYDRHCLNLPQNQIAEKLASGTPFVIRQFIPAGKTTFKDEIFGKITIEHEEIEDQVLIKSDGMPTYNFANVIDDHTMAITHVVRGSEYLTSTPKYNLLYKAFGWDIPTYVHLPLMLNEQGEKLSKRHGAASFQDLLDMGYLPAAIINYIAFLGWSSPDNREYFTLAELAEVFDIKNISKSSSLFDHKKLAWMNGEHIKRLDSEVFYKMALPFLESSLKGKTADFRDFRKIASTVQSRIAFLKEIPELLDFVDKLPEYDIALFVHKKMKSSTETALAALTAILPLYEKVSTEDWHNDNLYNIAVECGKTLEYKNSQILWPIRTALSGKESSPGGASELCEMFGKEESLRRIGVAIGKLGGT